MALTPAVEPMSTDDAYPATVELPGYEIRPLSVEDAAALALAYIDNREHLEPWEPRRTPDFFRQAGQHKDSEAKVAGAGAGQQDPWVIWHGDDVVGRVNLTNIARGVFQNASLGYRNLAGPRPVPERPSPQPTGVTPTPRPTPSERDQWVRAAAALEPRQKQRTEWFMRKWESQ